MRVSDEKFEKDAKRPDLVPEVTPEVTPEVSDLSGGEQNNGKVPG
jgi:hypothetical protein